MTNQKVATSIAARDVKQKGSGSILVQVFTKNHIHSIATWWNSILASMPEMV